MLNSTCIKKACAIVHYSICIAGILYGSPISGPVTSVFFVPAFPNSSGSAVGRSYRRLVGGHVDAMYHTHETCLSTEEADEAAKVRLQDNIA